MGARWVYGLAMTLLLLLGGLGCGQAAPVQVEVVTPTPAPLPTEAPTLPPTATYDLGTRLNLAGLDVTLTSVTTAPSIWWSNAVDVTAHFTVESVTTDWQTLNTTFTLYTASGIKQQSVDITLGPGLQMTDDHITYGSVTCDQFVGQMALDTGSVNVYGQKVMWQFAAPSVTCPSS